MVKIVCEDSEAGRELARKVIGKLGFDGIEAEMVIETLDGKAYLTAKDELLAEDMLNTKLAALYGERNFLAGQSSFIQGQLKVLRVALEKRKGDIPLMADIRKIENDLPILLEAYEHVNAALFKHIQEKYARGRKLLYCKTEV